MYGCSNYYKLFSTGSNCFSVDFGRDHRIDHVYPGKSFPCCFTCTLYVRCCSKLFRAYQKFLITLLFCLSFYFPAFAEDESYQFQYIGYEAMVNQGMDVNQYLNDQYQLERNNEIAQILSEPLADLNLLNTSKSSDLPFSVGGYRILSTTESSSSSFFFKPIYYGGSPNLATYYYTLNNLDYSYSNNGSGTSFKDETYIYKFTSVLDGVSYDFQVNKAFTHDDVGLVVTNNGIFSYMLQFLENCNTVFSWILDHITEIITFILSNAFLSVSLFLFICGAVISFYVRIRKS